MAIRNTGDLRALLIEAIEGVKANKMGVKEALAISNLSNRLLQSAQLDLKATQYAQNYNGSLRESTPLLPTKKEKEKRAIQ